MTEGGPRPNPLQDVPMEPSFVDTNILVYSISVDEPARQEIAQRLLGGLFASSNLRSSTQILQEFFVTSTAKIRRPITPHQALAFMDRVAEFPVAANDYPTVRQAAELSIADSISLWDALIVVAAARSGARRLYTEDLQHGRRMLGVEIVNPFA